MRVYLRSRVSMCSLALLCVVLGATGAFGQAAAPAAAPRSTGEQPPVLDRELFFGNPEITGAQLSPDGRYAAFIKPYKDTRNVWVKKAGEPFEAARLVTADTKRPIPG